MIKFFWQFIKPYKWRFLLVMQASFASPLIRYGFDYFLKLIVDALASVNHANLHHLLCLVGFYIFLELANLIVWRASGLALSYIGGKIIRDMLGFCYNRINQMPYSFFQNTQGGAIVSKLNGIISNFISFFDMLRNQFIQNVVGIIMALAIMAFINIYIFLVALVWSLVFVFIIYRMGPKLSSKSQLTADSLHGVFATIADNVTNIFAVLGFASRQKELNKVERIFNQDYIPKYKSNGLYNIFYNIVFDLLSVALFAFNLTFIVYLKSIGKVTSGDVVFVFVITFRFIDCIGRFTGGLQGVFYHIGTLNSALSIINEPISDIDKPNAIPIKITKGEINFQNVSFYYNKENPIFTGLTFNIKPGEKVGIMGSSGKGKTTLISILLKNFAIQSGDIIIDNQSILDTTSDSVRSQIALIPQDIMLFHRSLQENIGYGKENATLNEIIEAAKKANIHSFIDSLPEKYNTEVGERGIKLSGGQRQRIAIARAILKNAPILILDEATSSLDTETEELVQISIDEMIKNSHATVLAIAHRTSTLKNMNRIIEIGNGGVLREETFEEMILKLGK